MYVNDPVSRKIFSFDFDESVGRIMNQRALVNYKKEKLGIPYGLAVDLEGRLWATGCYDGRIYCWDQFTGKMLAYVEIPSRCVSACCFGGPDYDKPVFHSGLMLKIRSGVITAPGLPLLSKIWTLADNRQTNL